MLKTQISSVNAIEESEEITNQNKNNENIQENTKKSNRRKTRDTISSRRVKNSSYY